MRVLFEENAKQYNCYVLTVYLHNPHFPRVRSSQHGEHPLDVPVSLLVLFVQWSTIVPSSSLAVRNASRTIACGPEEDKKGEAYILQGDVL